MCVEIEQKVQKNKNTPKKSNSTGSSIRTGGVGGAAGKSGDTDHGTISLISSTDHEAMRSGMHSLMSSLDNMMAEMKNR
jgi:hypothetical protein